MFTRFAITSELSISRRFVASSSSPQRSRRIRCPICRAPFPQAPSFPSDAGAAKNNNNNNNNLTHKTQRNASASAELNFLARKHIMGHIPSILPATNVVSHRELDIVPALTRPDGSTFPAASSIGHDAPSTEILDPLIYFAENRGEIEALRRQRRECNGGDGSGVDGDDDELHYQGQDDLRELALSLPLCTRGKVPDDNTTMSCSVDHNRHEQQQQTYGTIILSDMVEDQLTRETVFVLRDSINLLEKATTRKPKNREEEGEGNETQSRSGSSRSTNNNYFDYGTVAVFAPQEIIMELHLVIQTWDFSERVSVVFLTSFSYFHMFYLSDAFERTMLAKSHHQPKNNSKKSPSGSLPIHHRHQYALIVKQENSMLSKRENNYNEKEFLSLSRSLPKEKLVCYQLGAKTEAISDVSRRLVLTKLRDVFLL